MTFIKLTDANGQTKYTINAACIVLYYRDYHDDRTIIMLDGNWDNRWYVKETTEEIEKLIKEINNGAKCPH